VAYGALPFNEAIGKEAGMGFDRAERLRSLAFLDEAVFPQLAEYGLNNLGLVRGRCAVEDVEVDIEPVIDRLMDGMILGAKSLRVEAFLESLGFCGSTVLVLSIPK
jgi:hypothetical protein